MMTKTLKLLILQGLPASGKSTFAKKLCKDNPNTWVRVCRDDIRSMLGTYWVPDREKLVDRLERNNIIISLEKRYNVIIDATNLNKKTIQRWESLVGDFYNQEDSPKVIVEFKEFKIPLWKAIWRDWKRGLFGGRSVGSKVIKGFYKKYYG